MFDNKKIYDLIYKCDNELNNAKFDMEEISTYNTNKVLKALQEERIELRHFNQSSGYGYDDIGRDVLCKVYARVFNTEKAIVSPLLTSGTHTIKLALFALLRPGDHFISISGNPYDTLCNVISKDGIGSLADFNITFDKINLVNNDFDYEGIKSYLNSKKVKLIFIGRSRGYEWREALSIHKIEKVCKLIKNINKDTIIVVDNCYGEFTQKKEPSDVGADVVCGSLIKNPGGSLASTGGYLVGKENYIDMIANQFTAPGIGMEVGSYESSYRMFYQGLFMAPMIVKNAIWGSLLIQKVFNKLGYKTMPSGEGGQNDIIASIKFNNENELISFIRTVQKFSPVDSHVVPYPWDMPGYTSQVIMAAGAFVQGSSIELSADAPIKEPYIAYVQGGISYEHIKICLYNILENMQIFI